MNGLHPCPSLTGWPPGARKGELFSNTVVIRILEPSGLAGLRIRRLPGVKVGLTRAELVARIGLPDYLVQREGGATEQIFLLVGGLNERPSAPPGPAAATPRIVIALDRDGRVRDVRRLP